MKVAGLIAFKTSTEFCFTELKPIVNLQEFKLVGINVYLSVRSRNFSCSVEAFNSQGRSISGSVHGVAGETLIPLELHSEGAATIRVTSGRAGDYEIRVIDADWEVAGEE